MPTPTQQLADTLIDGGVQHFIASRRASEKPMSWRKIALAIEKATDGRINVAPETVRAWAEPRERVA